MLVMKPYYEADGITIYHGDCREFGLLGDVTVTDPPYGIGWKPRVNNRDSGWDDSERADIVWLLRGSLCVWGGNYYSDVLPPSESWLIWLKRPAVVFDGDERTYAPLEMAWTNFGGRPRCKTHVWDGGKRQGDKQNRTFCHPAQKPVEVMAWSIACSDTEGAVFDPFMGSGTTLVAAKNLGRKAIGIEIEERYCEIAAERLSQTVLAL